jgi:TetR/AcrR family transcriptional regulator
MKMTRKERERIARRELIIDAAESLIEQLGFDNVTMDNIAEKAEVGKGTLYLHFKSKTSIYLAICERGSRLLNHALGKVLLLDNPGLKLVENLGHAYLDFVQNNPVYFTVFNYYESIINDENLAGSELAQSCEKSAKEAMTYIVRALQIGMQDGSIKKTYEPYELGLIIWGASKGVIHMAFLKQNKYHARILDDVNFSLHSLVNNFIRLIATGMAVDPQSKNE